MSAISLQCSVENDEVVTPIFRLTKSQIWHIMENAVSNEKLRHFDVSVEHSVQGPYGLRGDKIIPTIDYVTRSGRTGRKTIFVKRHHDPEPMEAHHYYYLERQGAPIPRMYGVLTDEHEREIIFLEYLDVVTDEEPCYRFLNDPDQFPQFLKTIGRFNAIKPSREYAEQIRQDMSKRQGPGSWDWDKRLMSAVSTLENIWDYAVRGRLGYDLKSLCKSCMSGLSRLQMLARSLADSVNRLDIGLCVNDFYPHGTGWRQKTGEMLIFDLEDVGFAPRFYDVAPWVGAPDDVQPRCFTRDILAQFYLEQYINYGGSPVPVDQFLEETHTLWMAWTLTWLWWWLNEAIKGPTDTKKDPEKARQRGIEILYRDLNGLLSQVC